MVKRVSKIKKVYDCEDVELYLDKAIDKVKKEITPWIDAIDKRDVAQYDAAKKILMDMNAVITHRTETVEKSVETMRVELEEILQSRKLMTDQLVSSMEGIQKKIDDHIADETLDFKNIYKSMSEIQVNGGVYPLNEALKHIYNLHVKTHEKLEEIVGLVEPIQARRRWVIASKELIKKNGLLHFVFTSKFGAVIGTTILLLIVNTILKDVFNINFDLISIFKWLFGLLKGQS